MTLPTEAEVVELEQRWIEAQRSADSLHAYFDLNRGHGPADFKFLIADWRRLRGEYESCVKSHQKANAEIEEWEKLFDAAPAELAKDWEEADVVRYFSAIRSLVGELVGAVNEARYRPIVHIPEHRAPMQRCTVCLRRRDEGCRKDCPLGAALARAAEMGVGK